MCEGSCLATIRSYIHQGVLNLPERFSDACSEKYF